MAEKNPLEQVENTATALTGLAKAVPVYDDALQPLAKELGKAGGTVGKAVNRLLLPLEGMIWGFDQIAELLKRELPRRLKGVPAESLQTPPPNIAVPAIESLRYTAEQGALRDMYLNLLAAVMDARAVTSAHPAFVEIIRQLTPDEGLILGYFGRVERAPILWFRTATCTEAFTLLKTEAGIAHAQCFDLYMANLHRLNLLGTTDGSLESSSIREEMIKFHNHPAAIERQQAIARCRPGPIIDEHGLISLTPLGRAFVRVVANPPQVDAML